jgi:NAD(P)-dependent dehydrogenase (short-subunit alcohol dehydrogenase family)
VIAENKGQLDIVFANAGFVEPVPSLAVTPEHFDATFGANARGTFFTCRKPCRFSKTAAPLFLPGQVFGSRLYEFVS